MRKKVIIIGVIFTVTAILIFISILLIKFNDFQKQLSVYNNISINDKQNRVVYLFGVPDNVLGPVEIGDFGLSQRVYEVNGPEGNKNNMPSGTKIEDYNEWVYEQKNSFNRFEIEFDSTGNVKIISCYSKNMNFSDWGPIAGIYSGDNEEKILKLGKPTFDTIEDVTRIVDYSDIGIKYYLSKGQVYMAKMYQPKKGKGAIINRFLKTLFWYDLAPKSCTNV